MDLVRLQIICGIILLVALGVMIFAERRWPYTPGLRFRREGFWMDLIAYGVVQSAVVAVIIGFVQAVLISWMDGAWGGRPQIVTGWPLWAQVVFFLVLHDFHIYWFHRWCHHNRVLWRIHEAHHSAREVDWIAGMRSHFIELQWNGFVEFLPILLLGASPEVPIIKACLSGVWGSFIHANLHVPLGPLRYLINGPDLHRWHHADDLAVYFRNYATKFSIWDYLFRTAYLPEHRPERYGLPYRYPVTSYWKQHLVSFRPMDQKDC